MSLGNKITLGLCLLTCLFLYKAPVPFRSKVVDDSPQGIQSRRHGHEEAPQAVGFAEDPLNLTEGLVQLTPWIPVKVNFNQSKEVLRYTYHKMVNTMELACLHRDRLGNYGDGGWDMCLSGPYLPTREHCLVYSFGINNDWTFDDSVTERYGCVVRAFDPTMPGQNEEFKRGESIYFYPVGLSGIDGEISISDAMFPVKTFSSILKMTDDVGKVIDYLKMDIEASEWDAIPRMVSDGTLQRYVKQFAIELHSFSDIKENYLRFIKIVQSLGRVGFRKWLVNWNMACHDIDNATTCHEVYFLNKRFLDRK